jgi:hypothetical protein
MIQIPPGKRPGRRGDQLEHRGHMVAERPEEPPLQGHILKADDLVDVVGEKAGTSEPRYMGNQANANASRREQHGLDTIAPAGMD